jgi:hypothetical protein
VDVDHARFGGLPATVARRGGDAPHPWVTGEDGLHVAGFDAGTGDRGPRARRPVGLAGGDAHVELREADVDLTGTPPARRAIHRGVTRHPG